ncbi:hypothetical protein FOA52_004304 [Chlamydomonas sp. UWO 241]|nr:hypothetical protein FOA52_004304 [Chlamydomonas sp. UWO 241]
MLNSSKPPTEQEANLVLLGCVSTSRWEDLWRCYQALKARGVRVYVDTLDVLWQAALRVCYVAHGAELFRAMTASQGYANQRQYTTVVSRLLKIRRRGLANRRLAYGLWRELLHSVGGQLAQLDAASLRIGIHASCRAGRIGEALELLRLMREARIRPGRGAYNIVMGFYCERGDTGAATRTLKEMRVMGYSPDIITFNTLASGYCVAGDAVRARAVIDKASREGVPPDARTFHPLLLVLARRGDVGGVRAVTAEMRARGLPRCGWAASALVQAHVASGDPSGAEAAAREGGWTEDSASRQPVVSNMLLQAYLRAGLAGEARARALVRALAASSQGGTLDADTYCLLMDFAASSGEGRAEPALALLAQMRAAGVAPDAVQLTTAAKALERSGRAREAVDVSDELASSANAEADGWALNQRVHLHARDESMAEAEAAAARAARYASDHGLAPPVPAYAALVKGYYRRRELRPLLVAFRAFLQMGGKPNRKMANAVVRLCLVSGDAATALQAIRAMRLLGVDMDADQYRSWVMQVQRRQRSTGAPFSSSGAGRDGGGGDAPGGVMGVALERLKWFLGLPNDYYSSELAGCNGIREETHGILAMRASLSAIRVVRATSNANLANTAWALAMLGHVDALFMGALVQAATLQLRSFNPQDLANTAWALAKMSHADAVFMGALVQAASSQLSNFMPQNLANMAWALATMGHVDTVFMGALAQAATTQLRNFEPQNLANMAWAMAALDEKKAVFMGALLEQAGTCRMHCTLPQLRQLFQSMMWLDTWQQAMTESRQVQRQSNYSQKSTTKKSTNSWQQKQHAVVSPKKQQAQAKKALHHVHDCQSGSHLLDSSWHTAVMRLAFSLMHDREGMQTSVATTWCTFKQMMASSSDSDEQSGAITTDEDMMAGCTSVDGNDGRDEQGSATMTIATTGAELDAEMASSLFGRRRPARRTTVDTDVGSNVVDGSLAPSCFSPSSVTPRPNATHVQASVDLMVVVTPCSRCATKDESMMMSDVMTSPDNNAAVSLDLSFLGLSNYKEPAATAVRPCLDLSSDFSNLLSSHFYSSHLDSSEEAEQVEPWDMSVLFDSVSAHLSGLSCCRFTMLTYEAHTSGHVTLYPEGEKYPEEEELVLGWQPKWVARQTVAVHVKVEGAPCSKAALVQEHKSAAMLAAVLAIESFNLHRSAAVSSEPVSSLGAAAPPQASTKEDQLLEKCTGAGGKAEKKRPVHVLLQAAGALGRAIKGCFSFERVRS